MDPIEYIEKTLADLQNGLGRYSLGADWLDEEGGWLTRTGEIDDKELDFYLNLPPEYDPVPCGSAKRPILGRKDGESSDEASAMSDLGSSSMLDQCSSHNTIQDHSSMLAQCSSNNTIQDHSFMLDHCSSNTFMQDHISILDQCSHNTIQDHSYSFLAPGHTSHRRPTREMSVSSGFSPPSSPGVTLHASQDSQSDTATNLMDMDIPLDVFKTTVQDLASLPTSPASRQSTGFFDFLEMSASNNISMPSLSCLNDNDINIKSPSFATTLTQQHTHNGLVGTDNARNGSCVSKLFNHHVSAVSPNEGSMCPSMSLSRVNSVSSLPPPSLQLTSASSMLMFPQEADARALYCVFCKKNRETREFYSTHILKDNRGRVICPILRKYVCPTCGATGERAHTVRHCPQRAENG